MHNACEGPVFNVNLFSHTVDAMYCRSGSGWVGTLNCNSNHAFTSYMKQEIGSRCMPK